MITSTNQGQEKQPREERWLSGRAQCIFLAVFHLSSDMVSFQRGAVGCLRGVGTNGGVGVGFTWLLPSGTPWNTTLNHREERKPVAH